MRRTGTSIHNASRSVNASILVAVACAAVGCSVYDSDLIAPSRQAAASTTATDGAVDGDMPDAASSGATTTTAASTAARDAGLPAAADGGRRPSSPFPIDTTACGDGRVSGPERCDTAIPQGQLGACPKDCPELKKCAPREVNGSGCQAECVLLELLCAGGDDCCPAKCSAENDADCSPSCGDGIIQASTGETCEPDTTTPCKQSDAECEDEDPCTVDTLTGNVDNCNTACMNTPKAEPVAGDTCCGDGANANTDDDCAPVCGNSVREVGEECDGETGCDDKCKPEMTPEQVSCLERFGDDECARCACLNCTATYLACRGGSDEAANTLCSAVLSCAIEHECFGDACYCSALCITANGPCAPEIEAAAATTDPVQILLLSTGANNTLGRSYLADECRVQQCGDVCR